MKYIWEFPDVDDIVHMSNIVTKTSLQLSIMDLIIENSTLIQYLFSFEIIYIWKKVKEHFKP